MSFSPIGFPAQPRSDLMSRLIGELRDRSDTTRQEAVTGLLSDPAKALGGKVSELLDLEQSLAEITQYREIIGQAESRASVIQGSLDLMRNLAVDLQISGQTALDAGIAQAGETVSTAARQALGAALSALNVSYNGRHLFSGDAGDTPAVAAVGVFMSASVTVLEAGPTAGAAYANLSVEFSVATGLFKTSFYTGGSGDAPTSEVARGERLGFALRADEEPIRALLRDLATLAAAFDPDNAIPEADRRGLAENAIAGLRNNVAALAGLSARVGVAEERMDQVKTRHQASEAALSLAYTKLAGRDQFEAASELTQLESQLEITFLATARLANLSLANFLR
jgi:flagellar hook-associated protein 3 FlgL